MSATGTDADPAADDALQCAGAAADREGRARGGRVEAVEVALDLEQGVVDRVVQPGALGPCELVVVAAEGRVFQVLQRAGQLGRSADRGRVVLVRGARPQDPLSGR